MQFPDRECSKDKAKKKQSRSPANLVPRLITSHPSSSFDTDGAAANLTVRQRDLPPRTQTAMPVAGYQSVELTSALVLMQTDTSGMKSACHLFVRVSTNFLLAGEVGSFALFSFGFQSRNTERLFRGFLQAARASDLFLPRACGFTAPHAALCSPSSDLREIPCACPAISCPF